jgi:hypothetical protein
MSGWAIRTGKPYLARDVLADPACAHLRLRALERGFQSLISLPLNVDGRSIGGFSIYARAPDAFDAEEVSLLTALTADIAYGVGALRREVARREAEGALRRVERVRRVLAECGRFLATLAGARVVPSVDTGVAARELCELKDRSRAVLGPPQAAKRYDLIELAQNVADHPENYTRFLLFASRDALKSQTKRILAQAGGRVGHVFNLGHGILPETPVENVIALVEMVHEMTHG